MNIKRSFIFAFERHGALKKLLFGGLFSMLFFAVFPAFAVFGYLSRLTCSLLEGRDTTLPEWDDLFALFNEGLQPVLILLVHASPFVALSIFSLYVDWDFLYLAQLVALVAASALLPVALIHFVTTGSLIRALDVSSNLRYLKANTRRFLSAWGLHLALFLAAMVIGGAVCVAVAVPVSMMAGERLNTMVVLMVGIAVWCFLSFFVIVISTHLFAQAYRSSAPFEDDVEGSVRSSIVMPPSLKDRK